MRVSKSSVRVDNRVVGGGGDLNAGGNKARHVSRSRSLLLWPSPCPCARAATTKASASRNDQDDDGDDDDDDGNDVDVCRLSNSRLAKAKAGKTLVSRQGRGKGNAGSDGDCDEETLSLWSLWFVATIMGVLLVLVLTRKEDIKNISDGVKLGSVTLWSHCIRERNRVDWSRLWSKLD